MLLQTHCTHQFVGVTQQNRLDWDSGEEGTWRKQDGKNLKKQQQGRHTRMKHLPVEDNKSSSNKRFSCYALQCSWNDPLMPVIPAALQCVHTSGKTRWDGFLIVCLTLVHEIFARCLENALCYSPGLNLMSALPLVVVPSGNISI